MAEYLSPLAEPFDFPAGEHGVLLLHGFTGSPAHMRKLGEALSARGFAARDILLPGHGTRYEDMRGCTWQDWLLAARMAAREMRERYARFSVAGLSMGGYVAMDIQRLYPETVAGLALCDTMAASDGVGGENRLKMADAAEQTNSVEPVMHFAQPADGDSTVKKTPEFIATMTGWINEQNPAGLAWRQRMTYGRPELGAVPETISAPSLVVSGELDPSSNPSVMRPLAERITGAEFIDIPDCGHFSAVEHPDTVARALLSLVKRVQSAQKNA